MRLVTFSVPTRPDSPATPDEGPATEPVLRAGLVLGDEVADLSRLAPAIPETVAGILASPPEARALVAKEGNRLPRLPLPAVRLHAPIPAPRKFLGLGQNYAAHAAERGMPVPEFPVFFNKQVTCVNGPFDPIEIPRIEGVPSTHVDYEGELGMVVARRCHRLTRENAASAIGGWVVCNDVSVRDWQRRAPTMTLGKSFDTHGPFGPWVVTADELDARDLRLTTTVSGELRQDGRTSDMVFGPEEVLVILSTVCTLEPGDVISTGTPSGVGEASDPPRFLRAGDVVRVEIEGIGRIENPVVDEAGR